MSSTETYNGKQCDQYANDKPIEVMCFCHTLLIFSVSIKKMLKNTEKGPRAQDDAERRMMLAEKSGEGVKHQKNLEGIIGK